MDITNDIDNSTYSDGDIYENSIYDAFKNNDAARISELLNTKEWTYNYHLNSSRENILNWYPFKKKSSLLEIGAGCGAITGILADKVDSVTAFEVSERRKKIIDERYKVKKNIKTILGNLFTYDFKEQFDYITSIGVLEYAGKGTKLDNPHEAFVAKCKELLNENGTFILAIENKLGLKYWTGAPEEHTGRQFDGLENYPNNDGIKTFSKKELTLLLKKAGFNKLMFYYPLPDYKFPREIFSEEFLPSKNFNIIADILPAYHWSEREYFFNEKQIFKTLIENDLFEEFANSFLVIAK